jgi:tetratricopeptide (TPR) repeat protein
MSDRKRGGNSTVSAGILYRLELVAILSAVVILVSPFVYLARDHHQIAPLKEEAAGFVGSKGCEACHQVEYKKWYGSHHDLAMDVASDETVLGDFGNRSYTDPYNGVHSRFYMESGDYMVETEGPDGELGQFKITHVFGVFPLQQYLIPFPGGRLQCLNIAWDSRDSQWYRLPPYDVKNSEDWLHWTNGAQTWNGMCAECHSTRLHKGYDMATESYETRWFEIDVGCEACHGPGSRHVTWAQQPPLARGHMNNYGLVVDSSQDDNDAQITICAPCHSRRFQLGDNDHGPGSLLDKMVPSLLDEGLYHADGQILEEVYVYGSFTQSKMYMNNVKCSDCHDLHSLETLLKDNELCLQCHRGEEYDTAKHHFHKREHEGKPSEGYLCVKCHMPGRYYMGIDYRPDHSLRVPRPDLSEKLDVPNSCSARGCHDNKPLNWVVEHYTRWYGEKRKPHYGEIFTEARRRNPGSGSELIRLAGDGLLPVIVRATALSLLSSYPGDETIAALQRALQDREALLRYTAIRNMGAVSRETLLSLVAPKLYDDVLAVRIEAALRLAALPESSLRADDLGAFQQALAEYRQAMLYNADFAAQRYNLGNLAIARGDSETAIAMFEGALRIDDQFYPAKVNLAMEFNRSGDNARAERLLREAVSQNPHLYEVAYSLGLLLAEMNNFSDAARFLGQAADGMPDYSRARYNQALALLKLQKWREGAEALEKAILAEPTSEEYFMTLANFYLSSGQIEQARQLAKRVLLLAPGHKGAGELQKSIPPR